MEHIWAIFTLGRLTPPKIGCIILASPTSMLGVSRSTAGECGESARSLNVSQITGCRWNRCAGLFGWTFFLGLGIAIFMVTFTINIPQMLAYIPAPWILWVWHVYGFCGVNPHNADQCCIFIRGWHVNTKGGHAVGCHWALRKVQLNCQVSWHMDILASRKTHLIRKIRTHPEGLTGKPQMKTNNPQQKSSFYNYVSVYVLQSRSAIQHAPKDSARLHSGRAPELSWIGRLFAWHLNYHLENL